MTRVLLFFPIALVISIVLSTLKCQKLGEIALEAGKLFLAICVASAGGGAILFLLVRNL